MKGINLIFQFLFENRYSKNALKDIGIELKNYAVLQKEYIKLITTEKLIRLFSILFLCLIMISLGVIVLFYATFALVFQLAPIVGGIPISLIIIVSSLLLFMLIIYIFRKKIIEKPIAILLINILYK